MTRPTCQPLTASTSGSSATRSNRSAGRPPFVNVPESITKSDCTRSPTSESIAAVNDAKNTARPTTTPVANNSAPVVAAVRVRLRSASRAPIRLSAFDRVGTTRIPSATAEASTVGTIETNTTETKTKTATVTATLFAVFVMIMKPPTIAAPATPSRSDRNKRTNRDGVRTESASTIASIGATEHARQAGNNAASSVATHPTTTASTKAGTDTSDPPTGIAVPSEPRTASINLASTSPTGAPMSDPIMARTAASRSATCIS